MSRSNYDKPFYVDVGTSIVAVRCASNHDVVSWFEHISNKFCIEFSEKMCDRLNQEVDLCVKERVLKVLKSVLDAQHHTYAKEGWPIIEAVENVISELTKGDVK